MAASSPEEEVLKWAFGNEAFFKALLKLLGEIRRTHMNVMDVLPSEGGTEEHTRKLLVANISVAALKKLENQFVELHQLALQDLPPLPDKQ